MMMTTVGKITPCNIHGSVVPVITIIITVLSITGIFVHMTLIVMHSLVNQLLVKIMIYSLVAIFLFVDSPLKVSHKKGQSLLVICWKI